VIFPDDTALYTTVHAHNFLANRRYPVCPLASIAGLTHTSECVQ